MLTHQVNQERLHLNYYKMQAPQKRMPLSIRGQLLQLH